MREVAGCGLFILLFDAVQNLALWAGLVFLECPTCKLLTAVWAFGAVKWATLHVFTSVLTDGKPMLVLHRFVALLSLLYPVFQSGRIFMAGPALVYLGPSPEVTMLLLGPLSSIVACVVWEKALCGNRNINDASEPSTTKLLMRMVKYFRADTLYLVGGFGFLILGVFCESFIPLYQGKVIDILRGHKPETNFSYVVGLLALFCLGSALFSGMRGGLLFFTLARLNRRLRHLLFHTCMQQEVHFFVENKPGSLSSRLDSDIDRMGRTVALNANMLVRSTVKTILMLILMFPLSWELTVLTFIEMPLLAILQTKYSTLSKMQKQQVQDCKAQKKDLVTQTIRGIRTVRSFEGEDDELWRYNEALDKMCAVNRRSGIYSAVYLLMRRVVSLVIKVLMLIQARKLISSGRLTIGSLLSFFLYQKAMLYSLKEFLYCFGETFSTIGVISKVFGYLDRTPNCKKEGELAPEKLQGKIVFQDVTFTYPSNQHGASLKSVSMELQPGKVTALVGPNGSGKTSCINLLKRLYEPQEGQILLDGEPLNHYKNKYLHKKIAVVPQSPELFSGSLRYNIEYGLTNSSIEKVKEVLKKVSRDDFLSELENKYDTDIGECGSKLSEGLKQCIAIGRALVRDPQVLILDEATSKLDSQAQHAVLREILFSGRTVLIVAHWLKIVEKASHIIFLENGTVVEEGTHEQLMDKKGRYYRLKEGKFSQHD